MGLKQVAEDAMPKRPGGGPGRSEAELDRQARAETDAGVGVPIEEVETWVDSWDTSNELPMPKARPVK